MKKFLYLVLVLLVNSILLGCATNKTPSSTYSSNEFNTDNYQTMLQKSLNLTESFSEFKNIPNAELAPADFAVLIQADMSFNQGNYANAAPLYIVLSNKYKDPRIILKSITSLSHLRQDATQQQELNNMINLLAQNDPDSNLVHLLEIKQNLKANNLTKAKSNLDHLMDSNSDNQRLILLFLSTNLVDLPHINELWVEYTLNKYKEYPEAHLLSSVAYTIDNNSFASNQQIEYMKHNYPNWEIPYYIISAILVKTQSWAEITNMFDIVTKYLPSLPIPLQNIYVISLIKTNKFNYANIYLQKTLSQLSLNNNDSMRGNIYLNLAMLQLESKDYALSLNYLKRADSYGHILNGTVPMLIGAIYDYKSNYKDAILYYNKVGDQNILLSQVSHLATIQDYMNLNDFTAVNSTLDKLAKLHKLNTKDTILLKSAFYIDAGQYQKSYDILVKNIKQYSKDKGYLYQYATTLAMLHKTKEAIKYYEKCIKLDKNNSLAYNDLAYILATQTKNIKLAKKLADKALSIDPENFAILDTLAWVYYKQANYPKALVYAKQAYSMNPDNDVAAHLKAIYIAIGNTDEANKIIIDTKEETKTKFKQFVLEKALLLVIYFQYGVEIK